MTITTFENGETFGSVRAKINANEVETETRLAELEAMITDCHFHNGATPFTTQSTDWTSLDEFTWSLAGGTYDIDLLVYFTGNTTTRDYQLRFLVNGNAVSEEFSKELKDTDDNMTYTTFTRFPIAAGGATITLQGRRSGSGSATLTVNRFRAKATRVCSV